MQIWKDIEGYKGHYQISNYGNVRSLKKDAFLMKICIRVINGDIKNENQKEATRLRGNFPPFNQK